MCKAKAAWIEMGRSFQHELIYKYQSSILEKFNICNFQPRIMISWDDIISYAG